MVYLVLAIVGTIIPLSPALYFLSTHGFNVVALAQQAIATSASLTAWLDVVLTALALLTWMLWEKRSSAVSSMALATRSSYGPHWPLLWSAVVFIPAIAPAPSCRTPAKATRRFLKQQGGA